MFKEIMKSSSKLLAFCVFFVGSAMAFKVIGENIDVGVEIFKWTIFGAGLLVGNKTIAQVFEKKFGGLK